MPIIAVANQKGGVGKTTAIIHLAGRARAEGHTAAILDMDTRQASVVHWGKLRKETGRDEPKVYAIRPEQIDAKIGSIADSVDWLFIDLPGNASAVDFKHADLTLIPARPTEADLVPSFATVQQIKGAKLQYAYLLSIVQHQTELGRAKEVAEALRSAGHTVAPVAIIQRLPISDAIAAGLTIDEYAPDSKADRAFKRLFAWMKDQVK